MSARAGIKKGFYNALNHTRGAYRARAFSSFQHVADKLVIQFPEERDGLNIEFNWSLADDDVTPHGDAYRNLKASKLLELAKGNNIEGKKFAALDVDSTGFYGDFDDAYEKVTTHLSHHTNIFGFDGAVGSYKDDRSRVRVITDSPIVALFAQNILVRVPIKDVHAHRPIVVYVATAGEFSNQEPKCYISAEQGGDADLAIKVVITGKADLSSIKDSIAAAKKKLMGLSQVESIALACDVLMKNEKTALIFNSSVKSRGSNLTSGSLYAAHMNIWNKFGVTSVFGGAIVDGSNSSSALPIGEGYAVSVPCHNLVEHPSAVIFVDNSTSKVKSISADEAVDFLKKLDGNSNEEKFKELLQNSEAKSYVVPNEKDVSGVLSQL